ncbi:MAG: hypothetical protein SNF33_01345 [Candidatus Algichlamydia australiensis]|nr:hypothetical protein [Chlamydiales bacterium]
MEGLKEVFSKKPQDPYKYMPFQRHDAPSGHLLYGQKSPPEYEHTPTSYFEVVSNGEVAMAPAEEGLSNRVSSFFQDLSSVPSMTSVISDLNATVITTSLDVLKIFDPEDSKPFLAIGNLSILSAATAPINLLDGYQTLKKTNNIAQYRLALLGLAISALQFVRGFLNLAKDFSIDIAGAAGKTFPKAQRGVAALISTLGLVFYGVVISYYGYKLSYHLNFQWNFSKLTRNPDAKKFLIKEYEKDPSLLKLKMGDLAFHKLDKMMKMRAERNKVLEDLHTNKSDSEEDLWRSRSEVNAILEQNEFDSMINSVKWAMRGESLVRMVGITACLVSVTSLLTASILSGMPALIATITLSLLGGTLWLISDSFTLWNSLQTGEKNWKTVLSLALLVSVSLLALNTVLLFAGGALSAAIIGGMVLFWFGLIGTMAWFHHRNSVASANKVDKKWVPFRRF